MKNPKPSQLPAVTLTEDEISRCNDIMNEVDETIGTLQFALQVMERRLKYGTETLPGWIMAQNEMCQWMLSEIAALVEAHYGELMHIGKRLDIRARASAAKK